MKLESILSKLDQAGVTVIARRAKSNYFAGEQEAVVSLALETIHQICQQQGKDFGTVLRDVAAHFEEDCDKDEYKEMHCDDCGKEFSERHACDCCSFCPKCCTCEARGIPRR